MSHVNSKSVIVCGAFVCLGLAALGHLLARSIVHVKERERRVVVKGLSEREVSADVAIWPITFQEAGDDLNDLFSTIETNNHRIVEFLGNAGFSQDEITVSAPAIADMQVQSYGEVHFRYAGSSTITVYTSKVETVRSSVTQLIELGKQGIAITSGYYQPQYLFTKLNDIKPSMIEEATKNARVVALKFAKDSESALGKIKTAQQGQFSIYDRDSSTPDIKLVRVVSTIEYYLSD